MLQRLINSVQTSPRLQTQETVLRPGQVVQGTIIEKLPGDMAVVQINNTKMIAKIEAPLQENGRYALQVQQMDNGQIVLKVVQPQGQIDAQIATLLKQLGVTSPTTEMKQLATMLINNNIPLTGAKFTELTNVLTKMPLGQEELQAIRLLIQKDLPLTETTIKSVLAYEKSPSLQKEIINVMNALTNEKELPKAAGQLREFLSTTYQSKQQDALVQVLTQGVIGKDKGGIESLLQKMNIGNLPEQVGSKAVQPSGALPVTELGRSESVKNMPPEQFVSFVKELPTKQEQVQQLLSYLNKDVSASKALQQFTMLVEKLPQLTQQEQQVVTKAMDSAFMMPSGKELASHMKLIVQSLGLEWEHSISGQQQKQEQLTSLKPLLLEALEEPLAQHTKGQMESLVHRITGQQLLSQETVGPMLHVTTHIPFTITGALRDVQIEWSGKETKDGQIDTDFCRIFFYLQLEALQDTGIDVHIQNRIVQITVLNNTEGLERIIPVYQQSLKEHLHGLRYELSAINVRPFTEEKVGNKTPSKSYYPRTYNGVDLHI
jgi:hypothetical protein